jgi:hypothetical protein
MALSVPLSRFTSRVGGGSAFFVRQNRPLSLMTLKKVSLFAAIGLAVYVGMLLFQQIRYAGVEYGHSVRFSGILQSMLLLPLAAFCWVVSRKGFGGETTPDKESTSKYWVGAVVSPLVFIALGMFVAFLSPRNENDWLGMRLLVPAGLGMLIGCASAVYCSVVSVRRNEKYCLIALLVGFPCAAGLVWSLAPFLRYLIFK